MREHGQSVIADDLMAPILERDGQTLAAHGWHDAESTNDSGTLYVGIEGVTRATSKDCVTRRKSTKRRRARGVRQVSWANTISANLHRGFPTDATNPGRQCKARLQRH